MKRFLIGFIVLLGGFILFCWLFSHATYPKAYREVVEKYASVYKLDPLLIAALIYSESQYLEEAVSSAGAIGLMQIMPTTAQEVAKELKLKAFVVEDLAFSEVNLQIGCFYLAKLKNRFKGELWLALAAYNAGERNVRMWLKDKSLPLPKNEILQFQETRRYVWKIETIYKCLSVCQKLGFV